MRSVACLLSLCALAGCAPRIPSEPPPDVLVARWDPSTGTIPTPTDLVRDATAGRLALPEDPALPPAELELRRFLNGLDGYPLSTPLSLPLSGPVEPTSTFAALFLVDVASGEELLLSPSLDEARGLLQASPPGTTPAPDGPATSLAPGRTYAFALRGYDGGASGAAGQPVIADAAFHLVRAREPLVEHPWAMPGATPLERQATAALLGQVQGAFAPLFELFLARGLQREEVAVLGSFTTSARPAIWFDPLSARIPLPCDLLLDSTTGKVVLPPAEGDAPELVAIKTGLGAYDGFSTTGAMVVHTTHPVDRDAVTGGPGALRVFRIDDGSFSEAEVRAEVIPDGSGYAITPTLALEHSARYAFVATRSGTAGALPLEAQSIGAMLRGASPLSIDGESQVGALSAGNAARLEPVRAAAAPLVEELVARGIPRDQLSAVVPFTTTTAPEWALAARAKLYEEDVPTGVTDVLSTTPIERGLVLFSVSRIVSGQLTIRDSLDPYTGAGLPDGAGQLRPISFVLTIPAGARPGEPLPVVLFGHGLSTSRELLYLIADRLGAAGYAALAIDLPFHGDRAICRQDMECNPGATCAADGACIAADGSRAGLLTAAVPWLPGAVAYPLTSGTYFVDAADLFASRDHFLQTLVDLCQALRVIRGADWATATGGYLLDGADVSYVGMSLGGIVGAALSAVEPTIGTFVLNVPGAGLVGLMQESSVLGPILQNGLTAKGIAPGTPEFFQFVGIAHWILDPVDPVNYAQHTVLAPLTYVDPEDGTTRTAQPKRVLLQMAQGDLVVPNSATELLAARMGVAHEVYTPLISNHGFLFDPTSLEGNRARNELVEFLDAR